MNCEEAQTLLEEHFDGETGPDESARLAAHLAACAACAALSEGLAREQEFYLATAPEPALAPDFWAGVAARARAEEGDAGAERARAARRGAGLWRPLRARAVSAFGAPRFSPALTAAAVLLAVGLTAAVMKFFDSRRAPSPAAVAREDGAPKVPAEATPEAPPPDARQTMAGAPDQTERKSEGRPAGELLAPTEPRRVVASNSPTPRARPRVEAQGGREPTADELVREAERKYVAAIALLSRDVRRRRPALDAAEAARFEQALATVDRAISDARRAARRRPDDPLAAQYMLAAYARKVDVLRELASH